MPYGPGGGGGTPATGARVYKAGPDQVIGAGFTPIVFDTLAFDTGAHWSALTPSRFFAPSAGLYIVGVSIFLPSGGSNILALVNGTVPFIGGCGPEPGGQINGFDVLLQLLAGDFVEFVTEVSTVRASNQVTAGWIVRLG